MTRYARLTAYDEHCLRVETPSRPLQVGVLAQLEGQALLDPSGQLRLDAIRAAVDARIDGIPELRRIVVRPGLLAGGPLWVDDAAFEVDRHVGAVDLGSPDDEAALLALVERLMARPLDRAHPLWRMWFVTGLASGRVALLVVLHHALADGVTAMRMVRALLGPPLPAAGPPPREARVIVAPPARLELMVDNLRSLTGSGAALLRPATWQRVATVVRYGQEAASLSRHLPPTSLNAPVGPRRRLAMLQVDLRTAKRVARATGCGVNDVVLALVAGGVRALLEARGEPVARLRPRAGVAVALFSPGHGAEPGNDIGTLHVPLPVAEQDPVARLPRIAAARARAARSPMVAAEPLVRATLGRLAIVRHAMERQRLVNLSETYLPGPPVPIEVLGARVLELRPIAPLAGNIGLSIVALSYAGRLGITVRADADQFPDLPVLSAAMERDWETLARSVSVTGRDRSAA